MLSSLAMAPNYSSTIVHALFPVALWRFSDTLPRTDLGTGWQVRNVPTVGKGNSPCLDESPEESFRGSSGLLVLLP
jgi:hypothetical protein